MNKQIIKVIEDLDWSITEHKNMIEIENCSPAGEHLIETIEFTTTAELVEQLKERYENFEVDEHVGMWVEAKNNGVSGAPSTIRELLDDAESIEKMLEELYIEVKKIADEKQRKEDLKQQYNEDNQVNVSGYTLYYNRTIKKYVVEDTSGLHDEKWTETDTLDSAIEDFYELLVNTGYYEDEEE